MIQMATIISINVSESGGVPKLPLKTAIINYDGVVGDYNKFRMEKEEWGSWKSCLFIFNGKNIATTKEGHPIDIGTAGEKFHNRRNGLVKIRSWYDYKTRGR